MGDCHSKGVDHYRLGHSTYQNARDPDLEVDSVRDLWAQPIWDYSPLWFAQKAGVVMAERGWTVKLT